MKTAKEKKESLILMGRRSRSGCSSSSEANKGSLIKPPKIEIHETGSSLEIILTHGVDHHDQFIFSEIVRILHEENVEVITANSSLAGDSVVHVVHAEVHTYIHTYASISPSILIKNFIIYCFGS